MNQAQGLVTLSDDKGNPYARLEFATGKQFDLNGKYMGTLTQAGADAYPEDGDVLMSQYADRVDLDHRGAVTGKKLSRRGGRNGGVQVNMDLGIGDVHIPAALQNFAGGYRLVEGVADAALPVLPVQKQSDYYFIWNSSNAFEPVSPIQGAPGAPPNEVNPTLSSTKYTAPEYSLAGFIPTEVEANADAPLRPYQAAVARVMNALRLAREQRVQAKLTTSGNWNANNVLALASGSQWNGGSSGDPIANIQYIEEQSYAPISRIVMGRPVFHAMQRSSAVRQYYAFKDGRDTILPSAEQISTIFQLPPITVADMKYTLAGAPTYVWPSSAGASSAVVLLHEPPQNPPTDGESVATGYTFRWTGASAPDGTVTGGFLVRSYYDPKRGGRGGRIIVLVHNDAEVITSNIVGGLITGVVQ